MKSFHVKKNDEVVVLSGSNKGKRGRIISVLAKKQRVIVDVAVLLVELRTCVGVVTLLGALVLKLHESVEATGSCRMGRIGGEDCIADRAETSRRREINRARHWWPLVVGAPRPLAAARRKVCSLTSAVTTVFLPTATSACGEQETHRDSRRPLTPSPRS